jgi:hypothetical protein
MGLQISALDKKIEAVDIKVDAGAVSGMSASAARLDSTPQDYQLHPRTSNLADGSQR